MTALIFLAGFAIGLFGAIAMPLLGIYSYVFIYFLRPEVRWWGGGLPDLRYGFLVALVTLLGFALSRHRSDVGELAKHRMVQLWFLLAILHFVVQPFALFPVIHMDFSINYLKVFVIGVIAIAVVDDFSKLRLFLFVFLIGEFYLGYEAYSIGRTGGGRLEGIGTSDSPDSNDTAALVATCIPWVASFALFAPTPYRLLAIAFAPFIANAVILINSRGAFLGIAAGMGYFMWLVLRSKQVPGSTRRLAIAGCLVGALGFLYLTDDAFWERMGTMLGIERTEEGSLEGDYSAVSRLVFWEAGFKVFLDNPMGLGTNAFIRAGGDVLPPEYRGRQGGRALHSVWMQTLVEMGAMGFVLFLSLLVLMFRSLFRSRRRAAALGQVEMTFVVIGLIAGLMCFLVAATFLDRFRAEIIYWYCVFAICLERILTRMETEPEQVSVAGAGATNDAGAPSLPPPPGRGNGGRRPSIYW